DEAQALVPLRVPGDHHAADDVGVAAEVLGGGVHDEVGAQLEGTLVGRGGERVVDGDESVAPAPHDLGDVDDIEQRVGGALDPEEARVGAHRGVDGGQIGLADEVVAQAPAAQHLVHQTVGAAVEVVGEHDVGPGLAGHRDERVLGGQARGEGDRLPALQL